jgi:broad specificity phosphatase PhoE
VSLRLVLIRHAATADMARAVFGGDGPLTEGARRRAGDLRAHLPKARSATRSPALCAAQTADVLGLAAVPVAALADWDLGAWTGRTLAEMEAEDPDGTCAWRTDPCSTPHGGESLRVLVDRVGGWLDQQDGEGTRAAVTHAAVIRAAVVHALGVPDAAFWSVDVAPTSVTELRRAHGRWLVARINWEPALFRDPRPRHASRRRRAKEVAS